MEEVKIINHFCHEHPLRLLTCENEEETKCCGCNKAVVISELAYCCMIDQCSSTSRIILHKRCAEIPKQIQHPSHPQHPLRLSINPYMYDFGPGFLCSLCGKYFKNTLSYSCSHCLLDIDISCHLLDIDGYLLQEQILKHPCHYHPLALQRKPDSLFLCDGCGTEDRDMAYVCSTCEFWVHKRCASLPSTIHKNIHHHHPLSLAFYFPFEHRRYNFKCDICREHFYPAYWVYYCDSCRYFAHVKCATSDNIITQLEYLNVEEDDGNSLIQLPVNDISKELITPFIMRQNGSISEINGMPTSIIIPATDSTFSVLFNYHKHHLSLINVDHDEESKEAEIMMISKSCDLCIRPILSSPYYTCAECKYFVHLSCYLLPKILHDDPLYANRSCENHKLTLYIGSNRAQNESFLSCWVCGYLTNGIAYCCRDCEFTVDVKCAALPTTVKHASHQHNLIKRILSEKEEKNRYRICDGCGFYIYKLYNRTVYCCSNNDCDFILHYRCAMLPRSIKHRWDKHPLLLTYDAYIDHPSDFYCEDCEEEIYPKRWMYHCRECDQSFHIKCLTESGHHKNIKFGHQFEFGDLHPHPLTYNLVSLKWKCDRCGDIAYKDRGFECASCNYVLCEYCCCIYHNIQLFF